MQAGSSEQGVERVDRVAEFCLVVVVAVEARLKTMLPISVLRVGNQDFLRERLVAAPGWVVKMSSPTIFLLRGKLCLCS